MPRTRVTAGNKQVSRKMTISFTGTRDEIIQQKEELSEAAMKAGFTRISAKTGERVGNISEYIRVSRHGRPIVHDGVKGMFFPLEENE